MNTRLTKERKRYLINFCRKYPRWKLELRGYDGVYGQAVHKLYSGDLDDHKLEYVVQRREELQNKIDLVNIVSNMTSPKYRNYILKAVTTGCPFEQLVIDGLDLDKESFNALYVRFFYILDSQFAPISTS